MLNETEPVKQSMHRSTLTYIFDISIFGNVFCYERSSFVQLCAI